MIHDLEETDEKLGSLKRKKKRIEKYKVCRMGQNKTDKVKEQIEENNQFGKVQADKGWNG